MAIIESRHHYDIYLSSTTPNDIRFRLLNNDAAIVNTLALYHDSLQQIDVYANNIYVSSINRDPKYSYLILNDRPNNLSFSSSPGSSYFNRLIDKYLGTSDQRHPHLLVVFIVGEEKNYWLLFSTQ